MEVVVATLTVPDLAEATRPGASHPLLGPFLGGGTYCRVEGGAETAEILDAARAAAAEGLPLSILAGPSAQELQAAGRRGALCLIVTGGADPRPLAILYGRSLPALGPIPAGTIQDLLGTWTALAGGMPQGGRHLLHEQAQEWDPQLERQLTQRLRQLYGE